MSKASNAINCRISKNSSLSLSEWLFNELKVEVARYTIVSLSSQEMKLFMDVSLILEGLNEAQRKVVGSPPANLLVLAGAGSGKTRVLVHRIAWLVQEENISPHSILAVTFTNKASKEMRARIEGFLGGSNRNLWVGTFHGIAHRLLKLHWKDAGLPQGFQIIDADDQLRLLKRIYKELNIDDERWPVKQSQWFINGQKDEGRRADYIEPSRDQFVEVMRSVYKAYELSCERGGLVDFGEILLRSHELWLKNPRLLAHYQERFKHVLVDEFQDTNTIQYAWLRVLVGAQSYITVVGDDDQSIYGWRGAKIENIRQFSVDFNDVETIRLEQNYRSTETILKAANAVIDNNTGRLGKELWTAGEAGAPISLYAAYNETDEARFVVEKIENWVSQGKLRSQAAILYRSNAQSRVLEEALVQAGVPYRIYGGHRFYDRLEIKNALAYLRLMVNRQDDSVFERIVNVPTRGIGNKTVEIVRLYARDNNLSLWQASLAIIENGALTARAANALVSFIELIDGLESNTQGLTLHDTMDHVIDVSGLITHHKKEKGEKAITRIENLQELVAACKEFKVEDNLFDDESEGDQSNVVAQFLDNAALDAGDAQADEFEDSVQLMTLHSAKGLEFPTVFLVGVEENLFPHRMSKDDPGGIEEERRLCYVGITRAMSQLTITYAETRRLYGKDNYNSPSRFIREIPKELIQRVRAEKSITQSTSFGSRSGRGNNYGGDKSFGGATTVLTGNERMNVATSDTGLYLGQRVNHGVFGEGTVLNSEGSGKQARVQVNFDDEGSKWMVLQYAKLEPVS